MAVFIFKPSKLEMFALDSALRIQNSSLYLHSLLYNQKKKKKDWTLQLRLWRQSFRFLRGVAFAVDRVATSYVTSARDCLSIASSSNHFLCVHQVNVNSLPSRPFFFCLTSSASADFQRNGNNVWGAWSGWVGRIGPCSHGGWQSETLTV